MNATQTMHIAAKGRKVDTMQTVKRLMMRMRRFPPKSTAHRLNKLF